MLAVGAVGALLTADLHRRHAQRLAGLGGLRAALLELDQLALAGLQVVELFVDPTQLGARGVELAGLVLGEVAAALGLGCLDDGLDGHLCRVTLVERSGDQGADVLQHDVTSR